MLSFKKQDRIASASWTLTSFCVKDWRKGLEDDHRREKRTMKRCVST